MTSEEGGFAVERGNSFVGSDAPDTSKAGTLTEAPYKYSSVLPLLVSLHPCGADP